MREIDAHFDAYEHLKHLPHDRDALQMLRRAASLVKPMMRKRGWKVGTLAEFLPDEPQLLGLNINRTERILIRLRYHHDSRQFLPMEQVTDTLLHELSHIVFGPHDHNFNNLWNELREEHQSLLAKGYTGEGFLSQGKKVGGKRVPLDEMRRQARLAAEKRKASTNANSGGHRLGGHSVTRGVDMRKVIADAATRRSSITDGCASGTAEAGRLVDQAEQEGFRTRAEHDDATDMAIARALQDLMEEEEMQRLCAPDGSGGLAWDPENGLSFDSDPPSRNSSPGQGRASGLGLTLSQPSSRSNTQRTSQGRPLSRLVTDHPSSSQTRRISTGHTSRLISPEEESRRTQAMSSSPPLASPSPTSPPLTSPPPPLDPVDPDKWACPTCTLHNPVEYLACGACGLEQPPQPIPRHQRYGPANIPAALPKPPPAAGLRGPSAKTPFEPAKGRIGWNCLNCGTFMEHQWWTCSLCGSMKAGS
ncbi:WLM domain-containing protein [Massariosphaeria phaeospora]|uniref:WLM domain-containing protein n=1 Tax=Massariosphaeria phaeospora TaxID=100035 RepID=A0A7C8ID46_9PLEO|nr:WLM domain-containing protein [Massariosphaeria phaeospora]